MDKIRLFCMLFIRVRKEEEDAVVRKVIAWSIDHFIAYSFDIHTKTYKLSLCFAAVVVKTTELVHTWFWQRLYFPPSFKFSFPIKFLIKLFKTQLFLLLPLPQIGLRCLVLVDTVIDLKNITRVYFDPQNIKY
jgi:hypothetical protein